MKRKEIYKISKRLETLELQLRDDYGLTKISGGFVHIDMKDYDDNYIYLIIKDGIQSDCQNTKNTTCTELWRDSLTWVD